MTDKEKIKEYLKYKEITASEFYKKTGLSNGFLDSGKGIGTDKLKIIISHFTDLNLNWLLFDHGDMIIRENSKRKYYEPDDNIDVVNESNTFADKFINYMESLIEKKDNQILELSEKLGQLKEELNQLRKK